MQGFWGVALFFVISGFCIHLRWAKQQATLGKTDINFFKFWKRRIHRLYPPYFVVLCLSMLMVYGAYKLGVQTSLGDKYPSPETHWMAYDFFLHITMLHGFSPMFDTAGGNNVLWSLAREEYFYFLYFPLMFFRRRSNVWITTGTVLCFGLLTNYVAYGFVNAEWQAFVARSATVLWFQWCLGMISVEAYYGLTRIPRWLSSLPLSAIWFTLAVFCRYRYAVLAPFLGGMAFFSLLNYCVQLEDTGFWPRWKIVHWFTGVGVFSYSLYLVHNPVRAVANQILHRFIKTNNEIGFWGIALFLGIVCYWAAKLFFYVVERHFLNTRKILRSSPAESQPAIHSAR